MYYLYIEYYGGSIVEISFKLSKKELVNFFSKNITKTKNYKKLTIIYNLICILLISVFFILSKDVHNVLINIFVLLIINLLMKIKFASYIGEKIFRRKYNHEKYSSNFSLTKLFINKSFLNVTTEFDKNYYKWESIYDIYLIDIYIILRTTSQIDIIIPNRAFKLNDMTKKVFLENIIKYTNLEVKKYFPTDIY